MTNPSDRHNTFLPDREKQTEQKNRQREMDWEGDSAGEKERMTRRASPVSLPGIAIPSRHTGDQ